MQKFPILFAIIFYCSSNLSFGQVTGQDMSKLAWLEGTWKSTNPKPGESGHERWTKISTNEWLGNSITMKGADTVFVEKIKIITKDNAIFYVADVPENKEPVLFRFSAITPNSFVCENQHHDFPKKIVYMKEGNKLKATISGNGKSIEYLFEKE